MCILQGHQDFQRTTNVLTEKIQPSIENIVRIMIFSQFVAIISPHIQTGII